MKFLLLLFPLITHASSELEDAKRSIYSLIQPLISRNATKPLGTEKFRVDGCPKKKINWGNVLLMRETATLEYKFSTHCDIQGTISPKLLQPFPATLELRNIQSYEKIETENTISAILETKPILNLEMRKGELSGKHRVKFEVDYQVQLDPMKKDELEKDLGGELRILELDGKKVSIKEKIRVK